MEIIPLELFEQDSKRLYYWHFPTMYILLLKNVMYSDYDQRE